MPGAGCRNVLRLLGLCHIGGANPGASNQPEGLLLLRLQLSSHQLSGCLKSGRELQELTEQCQLASMPLQHTPLCGVDNSSCFGSPPGRGWHDIPLAAHAASLSICQGPRLVQLRLVQAAAKGAKGQQVEALQPGRSSPTARLALRLRQARFFFPQPLTALVVHAYITRTSPEVDEGLGARACAGLNQNIRQVARGLKRALPADAALRFLRLIARRLRHRDGLGLAGCIAATRLYAGETVVCRQ
ncbi:hypothetical protein ABPG75_003555 [Micractinium tetrahymenae]